MKNLDLNNYGVQEMNAVEMEKMDGGVIPLVIIGVALLLSSCTVNVVTGNNNSINTTNDVDSTGNGNSAGHGSGNNIGR